jgi:hypothetical protein
MRLTALVIGATLLAAVPASGQEEPQSEQHPYGLDPYNPSDAALLRDYGVTLVSQTPIAELRKLDPYKPSHAALLRQLGGGIPLWGWAWYASPGPAPLTPFPPGRSMALPTVKVLLERQRAGGDEASADAATTPWRPSSMATLQKPESNDGVWIRYGQQKWISSGPPVPFEESAFQRIGEYGAFPVFRRAGAKDEVIYVQTRKGLMPYRLKS